jgi:hypothetical protein
MKGSILNRITAVDPPKNGQAIKSRAPDPESTSATPPPAPITLTTSIFEIDHRAIFIQEMRDDAAKLDEAAARIIREAAALRFAADHMEAHPPD